MKFKFATLVLLALVVCSAQAQKKKINPDDTLSNYEPATAFSPYFYSEKGNQYHAASGNPGPLYWQNRANYQINVKLDTTVKTISGTVVIDYTNNSPDNLSYLWLQLDQNTYKKDARSNFVTGLYPKPDQHTSGYQIESVSTEKGGLTKAVPFVINDTRMQVRLPVAVQAKATIR